MREIKFRAWHKKRKKFYPVLHLHTATVLNGGIWATCEGFNVVEQKEINISIQPEDIDIQQYTGLKDKKGKDIYEGDILQPFRSGRNHEPFVVKWNNNQACFVCDNGYSTSIDVSTWSNRVVIGNIHETPGPGLIS